MVQAIFEKLYEVGLYEAFLIFFGSGNSHSTVYWYIWWLYVYMTLVLLLSSKYLSTNSEQSCYVNYSLVTLFLQVVASSI